MRLKIDYNETGEIIGVYETTSRQYHDSPYDFEHGETIYVLSVLYPDTATTLGLYKAPDEAQNALLNCIAVGVREDRKTTKINVYPFREIPIENDYIDWNTFKGFEVRKVEF